MPFGMIQVRVEGFGEGPIWGELPTYLPTWVGIKLLGRREAALTVGFQLVAQCWNENNIHEGLQLCD